MIFSERGTPKPQQFNDYRKLSALPNEVKLNCILLVDDDRATNFLNKRLLDRMGVADLIKVARNGIEAMDYLMSASEGKGGYPVPDLILLDVNMPLVNGWEFLERYELLPGDFRQPIKVVMLTTSLHQDDIELVKKRPSVKGFLHKPLKDQEIRKVLSENFS